MATATEKKSVFKRMADYFREVKSELKKVIWPTFPKVVKNTGIVLIAIIVCAVVLGLFDYVFGMIFQKFLGI